MGKRLSKIYTRTGDAGTTGLGDGNRTEKDDARIEAIGTVDELNSWLGLVIEALTETGDTFSQLSAFLRTCQHRTFDLGGELSIPGYKIVTSDHVAAIEHELDRLNESLEPLTNFILPGGSRVVAEVHVARSICRRAERRVVTLSREADVNPEAMKFLNRLSDFLFVAARHIASVGGIDEVLWEQG
ncbi:MAG TPA: cob(I)yrinic acid a,c-diamide adenosyltransferase [Pseudomonadales bacterium]|nr:cob(I)yrinic acid a,c-diamide adenosyltransferase [Pseudomonadales bacterium]